MEYICCLCNIQLNEKNKKEHYNTKKHTARKELKYLELRFGENKVDINKIDNIIKDLEYHNNSSFCNHSL